MSLKNIIEEKNLFGKKVILRLDLNVPIQEGIISDNFRIKKTIPTLNFLASSGTKTIIVSHIESGEKTLKPVFEYLTKYFKVSFAKDFDELGTLVTEISGGEFILLENIRNFEGEVENDDVFAQKMASFGDIYVNDAFSVSHRKQASVVGLPKFLPSFAGPLFLSEMQNLSKAFNPSKPFLFILGGAKFETKLPVAEKFAVKADKIFIGGALANDCLKAKGFEVGDSLVSGKVYLKNIISKENLILPEDVIVVSNGKSIEKSADSILEGEKIVDVGAKTLLNLESLIKDSKFIVWNGPLGVYEKGFGEGTKKLAEMIAKSKDEAIIGGGDSVSAISGIKLSSNIFLSTAGGAMLDFLANETLVGIEALKDGVLNGLK